ncbi:hypothetical protein [Rhodococcus sp. USK13]|uniref:hypothetical protein n=1 Tax=Rhodococcus sp. USK13 TaxID=2806442 RepID=UPI001BCBD4DA|nr:hypothetical protein [Rhodococcus sp. USK13]
MSNQIDLFEPEPAEVERLAEVAFNAHSASSLHVPHLVRWHDITEPPRDRWRAALRAVLAAQATRPPDGRAQ